MSEPEIIGAIIPRATAQLGGDLSKKILHYEIFKHWREQLLAFLLREKIQTLITATEESYLPAQHFGQIFRVEQGRIL